MDQADNNPKNGAGAKVASESKSSATSGSASSAVPSAFASAGPRKKWLPFAIAAGIVVLVGGSASAYYFGVFQKPENVITDAFNNLARATALQTKGTVTVDVPASSGVKIKSIEYTSNFENNPSGEVDVKLNMEVTGGGFTLNAKGKLVDNGDLYFQINGSSSIKSLLEANGLNTSQVNAIFERIGKLEGEWVKITAANIKSSNQSVGTAYECYINAYKKHKNDDKKPIIEAYKNNAFLVKSEDLGTKDGMVGYKLKLDQEKAKSFGNALKDVPSFKEATDCFGGTSSSSSSTSVDTAASSEGTFTVWIDQWSHKLKKVEYSASSGAVSMNGNFELSYDTKVKTEAPSSSISFEEFQSRVQTLFSDLGLTGISTSTSTSTDTSTDTGTSNGDADVYLESEYSDDSSDI